MIALVFHLLLIGSLEEEIERSNIKISQLEELHDQEVAVMADTPLEVYPSEKDFLACIPQESFPFPKKIDGDLQAKIFTREELKDLMSCSTQDCKFNFTSSEAILFEEAKTPEERRDLFYRLYKERTTRMRGVDPRRSALFLRSRDEGFEDCEGSDFQKLLNERPVKTWPFRLSVVKYNKKMRPTTRLVQGVSWSTKNTLCYAEALIFSDHYDVDRVEVWSLRKTDQGNRLRFQLRHRIDLLNSWLRRLNKEKFRKESKQIAYTQMSSVVSCLNDRPKVKIGSIPRK